MSELKSKRAPSVSSNERAWEQVYDDINDIIKAVNNESGVESRNSASGKDGDIRLFKDVDRTKYFIEGRFSDGWAKRELIFSDTSDSGQDESINFSATESYIKPDGTVDFTAVQTGVAPTNTNHLATKGYVDTNATAFELTGNVTGGTSGAATVATTIATNAIAQAMMQNDSVGTNEILNSNVTYAKIQNVSATDRVLGRNSSGAGVVEEITPTQLAAIVAEAQSAGNDQDMFLAGTGVFREPSMGVTVAGISDTVIQSVADNHFLYYDYNAVSDTGFWKNRLLAVSDIPDLATSKITSGTFANARISEGSVTQHAAAVKSSASLMSSFDLFPDVSVSDQQIVKIVTQQGSYGTGSVSTSGNTHTITLNALNTDTNTNQLTRFYIRDDDNDAVYLAHDHYVKFATSGGVTTNWSATDAAGSSGDPHILTIGFDQSSITTVGTITSGTWSGSVIPSSKLDSDTAHLSGTQTFSGAKTFSAAATMSGLQVNGGSANNSSGQDATLYVSATSNDDWGIFLNKASYEYGLRVDIHATSSYALRILNNSGTEKFNITGTGTVTTGIWNGSAISATYIDSAIPRLASAQTFSGENTFSAKIKVGTTSSFPHTDCDLLVGGVNHTTSSAVAQFAGFVRVRDYMIIHSGSSADNAVGWRYGNGGLQTWTDSNGSGTENVYAGADVVAYYSSDPRLKKNKKKIKNPLKILDKINGYTFDWKDYAKNVGTHLVGSDYGVMADEIEEVMPELVHDRDNGYKGVKYEKIVPLLIECIKEQQVQINQLRKWKEDKKWI